MIGWIPSIYAAFYALGQFVNGQLGERLGARRMMTGALFIAAVTNLAMSSVSSFPAMLAIWAVNGYAQSAGWSLVVKTISEWTTSRRRGMVVGLISTCYQVGNVASWLLAGWLCSEWGWRTAFWVPGVVLLPITAGFLLLARNRPADAGLAPVRDDVSAEPTSTDSHPAPGGKLGGWEVLRATLRNRVLWILGLGYFCMNAVRYFFMNWAVVHDPVPRPSIKGSVHAVALPDRRGRRVSLGPDTLFDLCAYRALRPGGVCVAFVRIPARWVWRRLGLAGLICRPDMLTTARRRRRQPSAGRGGGTGFDAVLVVAVGLVGVVLVVAVGLVGVVLAFRMLDVVVALRVGGVLDRVAGVVPGPVVEDLVVLRHAAGEQEQGRTPGQQAKGLAGRPPVVPPAVHRSVHRSLRCHGAFFDSSPATLAARRASSANVPRGNSAKYAA